MAIAFISEWDDSESWRQAIEQHLGPTDWHDHWHDDWRGASALDRLADIEVALAWAPPIGLLASLPNLRLIVSLGMGVDHLIKDTALPAGPPITRIHDPQLIDQMVEYAVLASLRVLRGSDDYDAQQRARLWQRRALREAGDFGVGIMGLGAIGERVAQAHRALGFAVNGWSRRLRRLEGVSCFEGPDGLAPFLARTDLLICLLPLTAETRGILDARTLALLPAGAHVVNIARGGHVVEADLLAALDGGHLAGATLDVFGAEPLPADHPFWCHPKIRLTPHIAGQANPRTAAPGVADNIRRLRAGQPLHHLVDRLAGY